MKKIVFFTFLVLALYLLITIISILVTDSHRLTKYGLGYLTGKIILFVLFVFICFLTRKAIFDNKGHN